MSYEYDNIQIDIGGRHFFIDPVKLSEQLNKQG